MATSPAELTSYFTAMCDLRQELSAVRRSAIAALVELARQTTGPVRVNAERTLTKEFGPYAVGEGLPSCVAPIRLVEECDGNCRSCEWLWLNQQPPSERSSAVPLPLLVCCTDSCKPFAGRNSGPLAKTNAFRPVGSGGPLREFA